MCRHLAVIGKVVRSRVCSRTEFVNHREGDLLVGTGKLPVQIMVTTKNKAVHDEEHSARFLRFPVVSEQPLGPFYKAFLIYTRLSASLCVCFVGSVFGVHLTHNLRGTVLRLLADLLLLTLGALLQQGDVRTLDNKD